jgi:hypothetical protein
MEKVHSSSTNPSMDTTTISANFKYSLNHSMSIALLLIVTHDLVIGSVSKGSAIAFGAWVFMVSLNMHICKSKMLTSKDSTTYSNEGFTLYFTIMFLYDNHM